MTEISLDGKVAFVSGASKGIGVEIANLLASAGADLALTARNVEQLEQTADGIRDEYGAEVWAKPAELADRGQVRELANDVLGQYGHVDILVNNAGLTFPQTVLDVGDEEWDTTLNVNAFAPLLFTQAFAPGMIERGHGKIINVSSRAGIGALYEHASYSASKAAIQLLTQTMAVEFGPHNVQANAIAPTVILTPMAEQVWTPGGRTDAKLRRIPAGHFGIPGDVAQVVLFLASELSDFVNGVLIPVDGGEGAG